MAKNIFEQLGDALTGADKRAAEAKQAAEAAAAAAAARAQDEADRMEAFKETARRNQEDATAKAQDEARAAAEARFAEQQRQMKEAQQSAQAEESSRAQAAARTYTVKSGDSLWAIAQQVYGDGSKWPQIFEANRDKIKDANLIYPGQELAIP